MRPFIAMGGCLLTVLGAVVVLSALTVSCVSAGGGGLPLTPAWYSHASCDFGWVVGGVALIVAGLVAFVYGLVAARRIHPAVPQR